MYRIVWFKKNFGKFKYRLLRSLEFLKLGLIVGRCWSTTAVVDITLGFVLRTFDVLSVFLINNSTCFS